MCFGVEKPSRISSFYIAAPRNLSSNHSLTHLDLHFYNSQDEHGRRLLSRSKSRTTHHTQQTVHDLSEHLQPKNFEIRKVPIPEITDDEVLFKGTRTLWLSYKRYKLILPVQLHAAVCDNGDARSHRLLAGSL